MFVLRFEILTISFVAYYPFQLSLRLLAKVQLLIPYITIIIDKHSFSSLITIFKY